ncbi:hypothetical protein H9657_04600 [Cellulomonas sp. Sa3CUA2]|uniref:DUF559 domain-containing protein n=1 Tax=Cellulomonas avistercoris TaxID=2762242 RepID=A0ABR8QBA6_9CELL|nr:hypothetical protein [Cellulomonas avistercoris]MBD7917559.1 hypothetical protein [Cellulomonas avistercoris]
MRRPGPVPDALLQLARVQEGLVSTQQCDAAGLGRHRRATLRAGGVLLPVVRGVHDLAAEVERRWGPDVFGAPPPTSVTPRAAVRRDPDHLRRRSAWTALLMLGPGEAVAVGACALALHGVHGLPRDIRPEAALEPAGGRDPRAAARVRRFRVGDVRTVRGARVVAPDVALAQAVCELSREHAVAVLDSAVQQRLVAPDLGSVRALARGRRGAARAADWWPLVDGRAQSPLETRARLQCVDLGIPPDGIQVAVHDPRGRVVARGDLGWRLPDRRLLVVEIDGAGPHSTPAALFRDRARQNAVVASGALLLRFTAADVHDHRVAPEIRHHLAAAHRRARGSAASGG